MSKFIQETEITEAIEHLKAAHEILNFINEYDLLSTKNYIYQALVYLKCRDAKTPEDWRDANE
jgi:hypothetical protein